MNIDINSLLGETSQTASSSKVSSKADFNHEAFAISFAQITKPKADAAINPDTSVEPAIEGEVPISSVLMDSPLPETVSIAELQTRAIGARDQTENAALRPIHNVRSEAKAPISALPAEQVDGDSPALSTFTPLVAPDDAPTAFTQNTEIAVSTAVVDSQRVATELLPIASSTTPNVEEQRAANAPVPLQTEHKTSLVNASSHTPVETIGLRAVDSAGAVKTVTAPISGQAASPDAPAEIDRGAAATTHDKALRQTVSAHIAAANTQAMTPNMTLQSAETGELKQSPQAIMPVANGANLTTEPTAELSAPGNSPLNSATATASDSIAASIQAPEANKGGDTVQIRNQIHTPPSTPANIVVQPAQGTTPDSTQIESVAPPTVQGHTAANYASVSTDAPSIDVPTGTHNAESAAKVPSSMTLEADMDEAMIKHISSDAPVIKHDTGSALNISAPASDMPKIATEQFFNPVVSLTSPAAESAARSPLVMTTATMHTVQANAQPALQAVTESIIKAHMSQSGVTVRLDPPEMGNVTINFQFETADRGVTAIVRSDVPETAVLLRERADILHQALKDSGFTNINLSFEQNDQSHQTPFDYDDNLKGTSHLFAAEQAANDAAPLQTLGVKRALGDGVQIDLKL